MRDCFVICWSLFIIVVWLVGRREIDSITSKATVQTEDVSSSRANSPTVTVTGTVYGL